MRTFACWSLGLCESWTAQTQLQRQRLPAKAVEVPPLAARALLDPTLVKRAVTRHVGALGHWHYGFGAVEEDHGDGMR